MANICISGSRTILSESVIFAILDKEIKKEDIVFHGDAFGVDKVAERWCVKNNIPFKRFRPLDYSKSYYYLHRNAEMVGASDRLIAFWDMKSRGTKFTIDYFRARGKPTLVVELPK